MDLFKKTKKPSINDDGRYARLPMDDSSNFRPTSGYASDSGVRRDDGYRSDTALADHNSISSQFHIRSRNQKKKGRSMEFFGQQPLAPEKGRTAAYCVANELKISALIRGFGALFLDFASVNLFSDVIHARHKNGGDLFVFSYGCLVFWGFQEEQEKDYIKHISSYSVGPLSEKDIESDDMEFCMGDQSSICNHEAVLQSDDPVEMLSISFAFAQSVKLAVFEEAVETTINKTKHIPENLARTGHISLARDDISRKIGELFVERSYVNLHSDILDTPDFFWERDEWEFVYKRARKYLDLNNRVEVLNKRLDIIKELYDMLNDELHNQHASKLEWIVIYLILIELIIEVFWNILVKDILKLV
eukprot:GILI01026062.1.p1 GENE.GILI01026062.1~~GILI01026062.1.p1  ORF type:complete len:361 (-),score=70.57 GILI01026062.1:36-1118(-)